MADKVLFTWIGNSDLDGPEENKAKGPGPIVRLIEHTHFNLQEQYQTIYLLQDIIGNNIDRKNRVKHYITWIRNKLSIWSPETLLPDPVEVPLQSVTDMEDIYTGVKKNLENINSIRAGKEWHFLVSSGTPAMGVVWVLLSPQYNAILKECSEEAGISRITIPLPNYEKHLLPGLRKNYALTLGSSTNRFFLSWLGENDLECAENNFEYKNGPVYGFIVTEIKKTSYREIHIISELEPSRVEEFANKVKEKIAGINIIPHKVPLTDKSISSFFDSTDRIITDLRNQYNDPEIDLLLSPPLANIAILLAAAKYEKVRLFRTWFDNKIGKDNNEIVLLPLLKIKDDLDKMWINTDDWFHKGDIPHDFICDQYFKANFTKAVKSTWDWFPDLWFTRNESMKNLHSAIKCFCGFNFTIAEKKNLSVGGVFILAGMACVEAKVKNIFQDLNTWEHYSYSHSAVFPAQKVKEAKSCIKNLYYFFVRAFGKNGINRYEWKPPGYQLRLVLNWDVEDLLRQLSKQESLDIDTREESDPHTSTHLLRLYRKNLIRLGDPSENDEGIWLKKNIIFIEGGRLQG